MPMQEFDLPVPSGVTNAQASAPVIEPEGLKIIGAEEIAKALTTLKEYKDGKRSQDDRVRRNEEWYRLRHWGETGAQSDANNPEPSSAWLLNSLLNKHGDAMDNYPEPSVLPREKADKADAEALSEIVPALLEKIDYESVYDRKWWKKLKNGTGVTAVVWDPRAENGLGDVEIKVIDTLSLFWQPGISHIQDSANVFRVDAADNERLEAEYPVLRGKLGGQDISTVRYAHDDHIDTSKKTPVVDWYYKRRLESGRTVLHYCKFCAGEVLYASENKPEMQETGFYEHGKYPFVFDTLFPIEDTPVGFGYLDVCKDPQMFVDKLNQIVLKGAMMCKPRFFVRADGQINEKEYADLSRDFVHYQGSGNPKDNIMDIKPPELPGYLLNMIEFKVDELKETSGNNDFGQGATASGVTAASAIAALQEAGGKLARDMLKATYRAFMQECYLVIELIRQFYTVERHFRILGQDGVEKYVRYGNANIRPQMQTAEYGIALGPRVPVFDIKVRPHKANTFSRLSHNEMAKEFYSAGFFAPQNADQALACLGMMDFEGKEEVERRISQNDTLYQQVVMLQQQLQQMAAYVGIQPGGAAAAGNAAAGNPGRMQAAKEDPAHTQRMDNIRDRTQNTTNPKRTGG